MVQHINKKDDKDWCMKEEEGRNGEKRVTVTICSRNLMYILHISQQI